VVTLACVRPAYAVPAQRSQSTVRSDLVVGVRLLSRLPVFRLLVATGLCFSLLQAFLGPLVVPFFEGVLHATPTEVGLVASAQGATTLVTGVVLSTRSERLSPALLFVAGSCGLSVIAVVLAFAPSYLFALVAIAVLGVPSVLLSVGETTLLQSRVPDHLLGRAMGLFEGVLGLAMVAGAAAPAFATGALGVRGVVLAGSALGLLASVFAVAGYGRIVSTETVTSSSTSGSTSGPTPGPDGTRMCPSSSTNGGVTSRA